MIKNAIGTGLLLLALISNALGQTFVGTNTPNTGTSFSLALPAGTTNLSIVVSNSAAAYSHLYVKRGGAASPAAFDFSARLNGASNQIHLELPELSAPTNYTAHVFTPGSSAAHAFHLAVTNNRAGLRTQFPVTKPAVFTTTGGVTNGAWHYFQVDVPTNLANGWRLVLSHNGPGNPNLYVRRGQLPTTSSSDKSSTSAEVDTIVFTGAEATNATYFVGVHMPSGAANAASYTLTAETNYLTTLAWDNGATHAGTQVFTNSSASGGEYYFKVTAQNTTVGAMRVALNVTSGEADIFLRKDTFAAGVSSYTAKQSARAGSDGFVLGQGNEFSAGQDLYLLVRATPGAQWSLVAGQAHVIDFGNLAPSGSGLTSTNVTMGAEGWRLFRTTIPVGTLAWRLGLSGATNEILLRKTAVPTLVSANTYDQKQAAQMLVVPSYLMGGDSYYIGVPGEPGSSVDLDNRQQAITDLSFNGSANLNVSGYGYATFRIQVPVQQIAWLTAFQTTSGDGNFAVRRGAVANEWKNDAFSEVAGLAHESALLVPPTLSDGTFFVTVYGRGAFSGTFTSGNPPITDIPFAGLTTNDQPSLVGWRIYRVPDISSQLGFLGWDLFLANQPSGTEIALRRNAVPGRWNYRNDSSSVSTLGSVDFSSTTGFLQRQDHQADIWYLGVYNPAQALGAFVLDRRTYAATNVSSAASGVTVVDQPANQFRFFRIDVPAGIRGVDLRLTNITSGDPRIVVRRDRLPDGLNSHGASSSSGWSAAGDTAWPTTYQWAPGSDWTGLAQSPTGANESGRILAAGLGNPIEPGTYYLGVTGPSSATTPLSYSLSLRFIGETEAISIQPLAFANGTFTVTNVPREVDYFSFVVPGNTPNWRLKLTNIVGETSLLLQKDVIPNIGAASSRSPYTVGGGAEISKSGDEMFYLLPTSGQSNIAAGTYFGAVVHRGMNPTSQRIGTNGSSATLFSLGEIPVTELGLFNGPDAAHPDNIPGAEIKVYRFELPPGLLGVELRLENKMGNPKMALRLGTGIPSPTDSYGSFGGQSATWSSTELIYLPNPSAGVYTLTVQAGASGGNYLPAAFTFRIKQVTSTPIAFNGESLNVVAQPNDAWRYFSVTVPSNAFGWDLRLVNVTSGDPRLSIRRGAAPTSLSSYGATSGSGWSPAGSTSWPLLHQWAPGSDYTGYNSDANGANRSGHTLTCGMGNPLEPGDYVVGVYSGTGTGSGNPMTYTLESRGIGDGLAIPVQELSFSGGSATISNLPSRGYSFFRVHVPSNAPNWRITLTTNFGDSFFALQKDALPNIGTSDGLHPVTGNGGRRVKKLGNENYTLLPAANQSNLVAGTYYVAYVSEGMNPTTTRAGTNESSGTLASVGTIGTVDLGTLSSGADIMRAESLSGGEVRVFQFFVDPGVLSMQVRLTNRVGTPKMVLRRGPLTPSPTDNYSTDGGSSATWSDTTFIDIPNPVSDLYTLVIQAGGSSGAFPDASATLLIQATGTTPLAFDGGVLHVTNQPSGTWRYFSLVVPSNAAGWDLRITNVLSGDPRLSVRREQLPSGLSTVQSGSSGWGVSSATSWPTGYQWAPGGDWTGYANAADGTNENGHALAAGMGNPVSPGHYFIGVINSTGPGNANPMSYTLRSRGIGAGYLIPINPLPFVGSVNGGPLGVREANYYRVTIPSNTPNWRLRLTPTVGEAVLLVNKDVIPSIVASDSAYAPGVNGGHRMQRIGQEHYVLMPTSGTNIPAGDYFVGVASEGMNPSGNRSGTNRISYTLASLGSFEPQQLGSVMDSDAVVAGSSEGGEPRFYNFTVPPNSAGIELRLENAIGSPRLRLRTGSVFPESYSSINYGYDGGASATWDNASLITIPNPAPTNYSLLVQAPATSANVSFTLRIHPSPVEELNFAANLNTNGFTNVAIGSLLDNQRAFYRFTIPATNNGAPVLGWNLALNTSAGAATLRVKKDSLPVDGEANLMPFVSQAVIAPPFLTSGTYFVEVKAAGGTTYTLTSSDVQLQRSAWDMPLAGQLPSTPGLTAPDFADTGVQTNGVPLPGDQGVDVPQGGFHYYAISVPEFNGGLIRVLLEAISGNPDFYLRRGALPTVSHAANGGSGSIYDRLLDATGTEYANFVALEGRYETALGAGTWYVAVRGSGNANARYRLKLSTGNVTEIPLHGANLVDQVVAARDFRYYRVSVPTNAPTAWQVSFTEQIGNVILYVRDTTPPGQGTSVTEYREWSSDNKNSGPYATYDNAGSYSFKVPPLRPGHVYYLGFRGVTDGTFSLTTSTNGQNINAAGTLPFFGGTVSNALPAFGSATFRIDVPADARRLRITNFAGASVKAYVEQGTLPTLTTSDDWNGSGSVLLNQALTVGSGWPWVPAQSYFLTITNTSGVAQNFSTLIDGRDCVNDDNDGDGMPDCWEQFYFGGTSATATQDADNDGNNNLLEYLDETNPTLASSMLARLTIVTNGLGAVNLSQAGPYPHGTLVTLTATPQANHIFVNWTGVGLGSANNPLVVSMTTNRVITAMFSYDYGAPGETRADYRFTNTLASSIGTPPELTAISTNVWFTNAVVDGESRPVLRWLAGSGVQLQPSTTVFPTNVYTVALLFRFDTVSGWRRLLDMKNGVNDRGLYVRDGKLSLHPASVESIVCISTGVWHQVVMTRNAAGLVNVYSDGVWRAAYNDSANQYFVLNHFNSMRFFKDDAAEEGAGFVARIRSFATALSSNEVAALDRLPGAVPPPFALRNAQVNAANRFAFEVTGPIGSPVAVESTANFSGWTSVTNVPVFFGNLNVVTPTNAPAQYFRVRVP